MNEINENVITNATTLLVAFFMELIYMMASGESLVPKGDSSEKEVF